MSILIKNMEMPKSCNECRFSVDGWCYVCAPQSEEERKRITNNYCPLVEIPPHGRLIDADALIRQMEQMVKETNNVRYAWIDELGISLAPTIIEAEEAENA